MLMGAWPELECETRVVSTAGDRTQESGRPLPEIGGKGLFTAELERALREGEIDVAVHSLKDLPTEEAEGVVVGAVTRREDVRDCVVAREGGSLAELAKGAVVGTSSLRRAAQLRALRPDLEVRSIRGNVDTRIRKVADGEFDAALLAAAGVRRLGLEHEVTEWLSPETMLPAPGQGALAIQCRADDHPLRALLADARRPGGTRGDDRRARVPTRPGSRVRSAGRRARSGDDDHSCSSPGARGVCRWTSDGACRRGGRAAGARRRARPTRTR